ncbi:dTDP-4-dehydrorhamnose reductase [Methylomonas methanica]|uniref:dTDP-4-dehydrorhamnose reductase n=1 Tax=Methylomonas methanica (strain DSM 25384 / MC09) TaxID=857087 RepID=F9ZYD9_METMM|nr:dTDP-4-dehydrorhamnose reductase [Methylomonas methanica]AEG01044.1 dTDP-4-dehydrorhamnose reductase [Methylomonas methanica MC09]
MKILLLGKNGQVGWELQRSLAPLGELIALDRHSKTYCGDLGNLNGIVKTVEDLQPNVIVNAAAYTAVDKAETDIETADLINAQAPKVLADAARACGAWLVHYSTDYVFDGSGDHAWREDDVTGPLGVYGQTKLAGERAIQKSGALHLIFRTSWVYAARGNNFAKTMLRLAGEREQLSVINDQVGSPTGAELLADVTAHAIRTACCREDVAGLYHLVADGETSWFEYADYVLNFARDAGIPLKLATDGLRAIPTCQYPTPARRPLNSRLNTEKLKTAFDLCLPKWQSGVERMLTEIYGKQL